MPNEARRGGAGYNGGMMPFDVMAPPGTRTPRFRRVAPPPHELTERDLAIVAAVVRHGVLSSTHDRPSVPRGQPAAASSAAQAPLQPRRPRAPALPARGSQHGRALRYTPGPRVGRFVPGARPKEYDGNLPNLLHALAVSDFLVSAEVACRELAEDGLTYLPFERILRDAPLKTQGERMPGVWPVDLRYGGARKTSYVQPDGIFGFQLLNAKFYMLEVDNGTMPVVRRTPQQTSLLRKLLAYAETYRADIHKSRFGMGNMRVLFVVPSAERRETLRRAFRERVPGISPQIFLAIDQAGLAEANGLWPGVYVHKCRPLRKAMLACADAASVGYHKVGFGLS